ncbi:class II aldolase/adducin family protein [Acinetobacter soli]|uniref:class II aldolase/adducin family protein n=1 Tax=Acinetobacter soli TaxID=487316 RepID=UPI00125FF294|nr:class II aldolase/adducin family protein [Acinetobacter soli]
MNSAIALQQCSQEEWALRTKLTQCYHLVDYFGWTETIFNHISARLPGKEHHYLVNPFGLNYTEITPENLLKVDLDGNKVEPSEYDANPAGFALHSAVHGARDDIRCMIHTHTTPISAVVQKKHGFKHDSFYGAQLYGRVGYHTFEGITLFEDEKSRMIESLADHHILVLRNHGIAVGESSIEKAFFLLWTVQRAAEVQCQADAMAGEDMPLNHDVKQKCTDLTAMLIRESGFANKFFDAMVRKMNASRH